ncbi:hypothetical protein [Arthrobacter celericrescens]|nr:hypothetical protein [Arthrobacter celericrescens]
MTRRDRINTNRHNTAEPALYLRSGKEPATSRVPMPDYDGALFPDMVG